MLIFDIDHANIYALASDEIICTVYRSKHLLFTLYLKFRTFYFILRPTVF